MINSIMNFFKSKPDNFNPTDTSVITKELKESAKEYLRIILEKSNFNSIIAVNNDIDDIIYLMIEEESDASRIIGREGQTLFALQTIVQAYITKTCDQYVPVFIDSSDYLSTKIEKVQYKIKELEKKLSSERTSLECFPMSSFERRAIHTLYKDHPTIKTYSIGSGQDRRVILE